MKQQIFNGASGFAEGTRMKGYIFDSSLQNGWENGLFIDRSCSGRRAPVGLNERGLWKVIQRQSAAAFHKQTSTNVSTALLADTDCKSQVADKTGFVGKRCQL